MLLIALKKVCHAVLIQAISKDRPNEAKKWQTTLRDLIDKEVALPRSPNMKLWLTDLMINL